MRILDQERVPYTPYHYAHPSGAVDGASVTALLDRDPASVCKTLVTQGTSRQRYVLVIPVLRSLGLKTTVRTMGKKSIEMIPQARLFPLTGYVHEGCSPVGMKGLFPTMLDGSTEGLDAIAVNAGRIGTRVELIPATLYTLVDGALTLVSKQFFLRRGLFLRLLV